MSDDDIKRRLVDEIKLRGYDDRYIDRNEEREFLQLAIQLGVGIDAARVALDQVCEENGYLIESAVRRAVRGQLEAAVGSDGRLDRAGFDRVVKDTRVRLGGVKADRDVKRLVVAVMEETGYNRVRAGWLGNWYARLKRDLGVA